MSNFIAALLLAGFLCMGASTGSEFQIQNCPAPSGLCTTAKSGQSVAIAWDAVPGALGYEVRWVRTSDGLVGPTVQTTTTSHSFGGLQAGGYTFQVATVCSGGTSGWIGVEDTIVG